MRSWIAVDRYSLRAKSKASREVMLLGGFSNPLGLCEVRLAGRLVFLFLLRSLLLGCHEVFSSVNCFPCKVSSVGRLALFPIEPNFWYGPAC